MTVPVPSRDNGQALAEALYPRVSRILVEMGLRKELPDLPNIRWGRARGHAVHKAIELYERGELDPSTLHPDVRGPFAGYLAFKADTGYRPEAVEEAVVHRGLRYRGTLDSRGKYEGEMAVLDFKCGEPDKQAAAYQLAAYAMAEPFLLAVAPRYVVQLREDSYRVHNVTSDEAVQVFEAAAILWWAQRERLVLPGTRGAA